METWTTTPIDASTDSTLRAMLHEQAPLHPSCIK
jgi:hypothetical protein